MFCSSSTMKMVLSPFGPSMASKREAIANAVAANSVVDVSTGGGIGTDVTHVCIAHSMISGAHDAAHFSMPSQTTSSFTMQSDRQGVASTDSTGGGRGIEECVLPAMEGKASWARFVTRALWVL